MNTIDLQSLDAIRAANVVDYLRAHGWSDAASRRADVARYVRHTSQGDVFATVLLDDTFGDYRVRMAELAEVLSRVEDRPVLEVVNDLLTPPGDLLRFRIDSEATESGTLGINQSIQLRKAIKNLLLASAHSAISPAASYPRLSQQRAIALLEQCRERQSERGSYVASLLVPVQPPVGQLSIDEEFGRRTSRLLFTALQTAERSAADPARLLTARDQGISSNFLDALADLEPTGNRASIEVRVNWLGAPPHEDLVSAVRLPQAAFRQYRQAARALREQSPVNNTELEGYVIAVSRQPGAPDAWISVASFVEGFGEIRVKVRVDAPQHQVAGQAHLDGHRVRLIGTLTKSGRTHELTGHSGVEVLPVED